MKRSSLEGDYGLDKSLKRLEHDVEWSQDRAGLIRERIRADIYQIKKKRRRATFILVAATLFLIMSATPFLQEGLGLFSTEIKKETVLQDDEPISAKQQDKDIIFDPEHQLFPLNAQEFIEGISGEPTITGASYGKYPYQLIERPSEFLHVRIEPNVLSQEEMLEQLNPELYYHPSVPYESVELIVGEHPAFLKVSGQDMRGIILEVVTEDFVYLFSTPKSFQPKDMTNEEIIQLKADMIDLAKLFHFE